MVERKRVTEVQHKSVSTGDHTKKKKKNPSPFVGQQSSKPWLHSTKGWKGDGLRLVRTNHRRMMSARKG